MKITQIISETTAGCVATVAMPMGETQKRPKVSGLEPAEKVMFGKSKKKGPYGNSLSEGKMKDLTMDLRASKDGLSDIEFKKKYGKTKEEMRKSMQDARKEQKVNEAELSEQDLIVIPGQGRKLKTGFVPHGQSRIDHEVEMARSDLFSAAQNAQKVYSMIKDMSEEEGLEGWVQEKIIKANDYLNTIREYLEGKQVQGVTENNQRVDSLVTDALRIMKGAEVSDAVRALKTVLGDREYNGRRGHYNFYIKQMLDMYGQQGVAEGLDEAVGGNYLYHSTQDANTAKQILSSGYLLGNSGGKQPASNAQTTLPTVSFGRSIGYQTTGANVERDYQVVFVFDRTSIETRYKTLGTSQSQTVRGLANPIDTEWGRKVAKLGKVWGLDANADGKVDYKEIGNASKSTAPNMVKQGVSTQLNAPKAGGEFEEIVPTKTGKIPLQGLLVGFYLVPGKAASKDPELLNDPRRLDMPRPNQFVKANQAQGVAEGKIK